MEFVVGHLPDSVLSMFILLIRAVRQRTPLLSFPGARVCIYAGEGQSCDALARWKFLDAGEGEHVK